MIVPTRDLSASERHGLHIALYAAEKVLRRKARMGRLVKAGLRKMAKNPKAIPSAREDLCTLLRLTRAWSRKEFQAIPWRSLLYAVAALIYFVNPADILPDAIIGLGYIDDFAVISVVVRAIRMDLDRFKRWETTAPEAKTVVKRPSTATTAIYKPAVSRF